MEINVQMKPGYGTFKILKTVEGDGAPALAEGATFPIKVDLELPQLYNKFNPVWQPPAGFTMAADGIHGSGYINVQPGKNTYFDQVTTLPKYTKVTL